MDQLMAFLMGLMVFGGALVGAVGVIIWQRRKGGRTATQEAQNYREKMEEKRKEETAAARSEKMKDFMEFDKVEDDMIIQDGGNRFCMVVRCMGVNYDLMSENEMLAVEEGFGNFLNTLKFPIQLYVQSRTLDLSDGLALYHSRLDKIRSETEKFIEQVNMAKSSGSLDQAQRQQMDYEIKKKRNLIEYGTDIVSYIERMSTNRNILQRKYYMVVSYEASELGIANNFSLEETRDVAYSELYTRCKTLQAAIAPCGVETELLKSEDLAELLYIAYNKDDANNYNIREALREGVTRLYSTATSILEKKRAAKDAELQEKAIAEAENALKVAMESIRNKTYADAGILTEDEQFEDDTKKEAMQIILDNQDSFSPMVVDKALQDLNAGMHKPLVSQEELDAVDEETNAEQEQIDKEQQEYLNKNYSGSEEGLGVDNTLGSDPLADLLS
jgi:hypothetical protein